MKYTILIIVLLLSGCVFNNHPDIVVPPDKKVSLAAEALEPCSKLSETVEINTFDDAIFEYGKLATEYGLCANKQNSSIKLLKKFSNTGDNNGSK